MRNSDCHRLAKALLPQLPGFSTDKKKLIFIQPIGNVLRGFMFESTAYAREDFFFWRFIMPICGPIEYITLSHGDRLSVPGCRAGWRSDMRYFPETLLDVIRPDTTEALAKALPGATLWIVPGGSHSVMQEQPELVNRTVLEFLAH